MQNKTKNGDIFGQNLNISNKNNDQITHFVGVTQDVSDNKNLLTIFWKQNQKQKKATG